MIWIISFNRTIQHQPMTEKKISVEPSDTLIESKHQENKIESKKITDGYYSTNDYNHNKEKVYQVKFDGETIWKMHAKLKYGEVK